MIHLTPKKIITTISNLKTKEVYKTEEEWKETLSKEQYEYRYKFRKHPLIVAAIGQVEGRRHKALFNVGVYLKHNNCFP